MGHGLHSYFKLPDVKLPDVNYFARHFGCLTKHVTIEKDIAHHEKYRNWTNEERIIIGSIQKSDVPPIYGQWIIRSMIIKHDFFGTS